MCHSKRYIVWLLVLNLLGISTNKSSATSCLHLVGVVQDQYSQRPLEAQLYIQTPTGRIKLGKSSAKTGTFSISVICPATELLILCPGYRVQRLPLNMSSLTQSQTPISVIIPLISVDTQDVNKLYQQTEQTHFEQKATNTGQAQSQYNHFTISDALTKLPIEARVCFYFTKDERKKCLQINRTGQFSFSFKAKDIVAIEVSASGYQSYYGNLIIDELDGRHLNHQIKLTRALTILSVQTDAVDYRCLLQNPSNKKVTPLLPLPDYPYSAVANNLSPRTYLLIVSDRNQDILEQRQITVNPGLNLIKVNKNVIRNLPSETTVNADSLPFIYFEQSSFLLRQDAKKILLQIATYMSKDPSVKIQISGHTDKEGDERLNRFLSQNRAKVVFNFLAANGIPDTQMSCTGYGSQYVIAPSDKEENKVRNRRVQLKFTSH